jgi:hypothetical protein
MNEPSLQRPRSKSHVQMSLSQAMTPDGPRQVWGKVPPQPCADIWVWAVVALFCFALQREVSSRTHAMCRSSLHPAPSQGGPARASSRHKLGLYKRNHTPLGMFCTGGSVAQAPKEAQSNQGLTTKLNVRSQRLLRPLRPSPCRPAATKSQLSTQPTHTHVQSEPTSTTIAAAACPF